MYTKDHLYTMQPIIIHSLTPDRQPYIITTTQPQLAKHYKALKNKGHHQITATNQPPQNMTTTYCITCQHNHTWQNMNGEPYQCDPCWGKENKATDHCTDCETTDTLMIIN
jgi:hypothetical protein